MRARLPCRFIVCGLASLSIAAPLASAEYSSSVLYPLPVPAGFTLAGARETAPDGSIGFGLLAGPGNLSHALLWPSPGGAPIDLNPTNLGDDSGSRGEAAFGNQQVGLGSGSATGGLSHAILWTETASSAIDLNPTHLPAVVSSAAYGTDGSQQVGEGRSAGPSFISHALLWSGTADSATDLNPTNIPRTVGSKAFAVRNGQQVGYGSITGEGMVAMLWNGTASSAVDLHPAGFTFSVAFDTTGVQQVGVARNAGEESHALLWTGTAESAIDLSPTNLPSFIGSSAVATNGLQQVGSGYTGADDNDQALLWSGTPNSAVNLHLALPSSGVWISSQASSIDALGNIFGTANGTYNGLTEDFAVEWSPVPEPASSTLFVIAVSGLLKRRARVCD